MTAKKVMTGKKKLTSEKKVKFGDIPERKKALTEEQAKEVKAGKLDWSGPGDEGPEESFLYRR